MRSKNAGTILGKRVRGPTLQTKATIVRSPVVRIVEHATPIVGSRSIAAVDCCSAIFLRQQVLNLPGVLLCSNAELKVFPSDRVPVLQDVSSLLDPLSNKHVGYLINHHDCKKITNSGDKQSVEVMRCRLAD